MRRNTRQSRYCHLRMPLTALFKIGTKRCCPTRLCQQYWDFMGQGAAFADKPIHTLRRTGFVIPSAKFCATLDVSRLARRVRAGIANTGPLLYTQVWRYLSENMNVRQFQRASLTPRRKGAKAQRKSLFFAPLRALRETSFSNNDGITLIPRNISTRTVLCITARVPTWEPLTCKLLLCLSGGKPELQKPHSQAGAWERANTLYDNNE